MVVEQFIKPATLKVVDPNQYGTASKLSTTHALISIVHNLAKTTDGNGAFVRLVLLDFRKAFDLIDPSDTHRKVRFSGTTEYCLVSSTG